MKHDLRVYVAGHRGLAGGAILRRLQAVGYRSIVTASHAELDLVDQARVRRFFAEQRPQHVYLAAAKVGGIHANNVFRADYIYENLMIESNVIRAAYDYGAEKLLFLGSSCIYPKLAPQPMKEEHLLTGLLEPTNEPYAIAKIAGIKLCAAFNAQYGTNFLSVMPTNLYGLGDNYDLEVSHVLPALLRKMHEAMLRNADEVSVWGTGAPRREFLYSEDLADACVYLMRRYDAEDLGEFINVGVGTDISIRELAELAADTVGYRGKLTFDPSKPDGTPQKLLDVSRLRAMGWEACTGLRDGMRMAYQDFVRSEGLGATRRR